MMGSLEQTIGVLKAMGHPVRLRILAMLREGELCVCQMTALLDLATSTVSAHLSDLKRAGLVSERKQARWVFYRLVDEESPTLASVWATVARDEQVQADVRLLRQIKKVDIAELCRVDLDLKALGIRRCEPGRPSAAGKKTA
ncbi:MAG: metalloregulator ArsR/SmtB family transcription factor [Acidobacteriota bacterium]